MPPNPDPTAQARIDDLREDVRELRKEIDEVDDRVAACLSQLMEHRASSDAAHKTTREQLDAVARRLDQMNPAAPPAAAGSALATMPGPAVAAVGTLIGSILTAVLLGLAQALGHELPPPAAPPSDEVDIMPVDDVVHRPDIAP